ncbi:hypothetical protein HDK77DRAFT_456065 [Phyllosticta capitalensis]
MPSSSSSSHKPSHLSHSFLPRKPSILRRDRDRSSRKAASSSEPSSRSQTPIPHRSTTPLPPTIDESDAPHSVSLSPSKKNRHSFASSVSDLGSSLRRSASIRSSSNSITSAETKDHHPSRPNLAASLSTEKASNASSSKLSIHHFRRGRQKSHDSSLDADFRNMASGTPASQWDRPPGTSASNATFGGKTGSLGGSANLSQVPSSGGHNPHALYQHIHDLSSKRISTLDYLRKAHDGRVYWFNTLLFNKADLNKLPYFSPRNLARRATNYLLLGFSIPTILDMNSQSAAEYLRALNALLMEFEAYQTLHPPDGNAPSSLSRGRVAGMFKRGMHAASGAAKGRRQSSATELMLPEGLGETSSNASQLSFPGTDHGDHLSPGEEYSHLLTPSLPFDPDFFETFSTLCDVLIDCYTKIMNLVNGPEACGLGVGELFAKADARIRKIIVAGVVREFEDASRAGAKSEIAGVGKVVLGGLISTKA